MLFRFSVLNIHLHVAERLLGTAMFSHIVLIRTFGSVSGSNFGDEAEHFWKSESWELAGAVCYKWASLLSRNAENPSRENTPSCLQQDNQQPEVWKQWESGLCECRHSSLCLSERQMLF